MNAVQPTRLYSGILCSKHKMCRHDCSILYARFPFPIRVSIDVILVESNHEDRRGAICAWCARVNLCQDLWRLADIDVLLLKVLGSRSHTAGLQYCRQSIVLPQSSSKLEFPLSHFVTSLGCLFEELIVIIAIFPKRCISCLRYKITADSKVYIGFMRLRKLITSGNAV